MSSIKAQRGEPCLGLSSTSRPVPALNKKSCTVRLTVMNGGTRHTAPSVYNTQNFGPSALIRKYLVRFLKTTPVSEPSLSLPPLQCPLQFSADRVLKPVYNSSTPLPVQWLWSEALPPSCRFDSECKCRPSKWHPRQGRVYHSADRLNNSWRVNR